MPLVVKEPESKDWERPEDGQYLAVIADVIDLGEQPNPFGTPKQKVQIKWLLDAFDAEGNQFQVSAMYTASLHKKSNLRKALHSILGADVEGTFDMEDLIGINNQLVTQQHESTEGKVYANIVAILKAPKGSKRLEVPADFVRKADQNKKQAPAKKPAPGLKKPTPPVQQEQVEEQEQVAAPVQAPVQQPKAPAPANRAGVIRQARTVTPAAAPVAAPVAATTSRAALLAQLAALEAAEATSEAQPINDDDIPF